VIFGEAAEIISKAIGNVSAGNRPFSKITCAGVKEAVQSASRYAQPGVVVLFAPGGTSYDAFKDFEERGAQFTKWVHELS
jgi:UDP-N-acetylmuramoylalanine--D-glutamate ligase